MNPETPYSAGHATNANPATICPSRRIRPLPRQDLEIISVIGIGFVAFFRVAFALGLGYEWTHWTWQLAFSHLSVKAISPAGITPNLLGILDDPVPFRSKDNPDFYRTLGLYESEAGK